jgi:large subunit ribosomal protein L24
MANKFKKGDEIIVLTGKDKGKRGMITKVNTETARVVVENINMVKKHQKPNPNMNVPGGIIEKEMPIDVSNVAMFNPVTGKADRIGFKTLDDGRKVRVFKSNGEVVDV